MLLKDRGIVLKHLNTGEADKIVTILTQHNGKLKAIIRGCRKPKSRYISVAEQFAVSEFVLYKGNGDLFSVSQAETEETFFSLRDDLLLLSYGNYFAELAEIVSDEDVQSDRLFSNLVWALHYLSKRSVGPGLVSLTYLLKLMELSGYKPMLISCANCHEPVLDSESFSIQMGGMLCKKCGLVDKRTKRLSVPGRLNMLQLLDKNMSGLTEISIEDREFTEMDTIIKEFVMTHLGRNPKSSVFLESIKRSIDPLL